MATVPKTLAAINLTAAGTAQVISTAAELAQSLIITAHPSNTGYIYIGDDDVSSTRYLVRLAAGDSVVFDGAAIGSGNTDYLDLSKFYFDGDTTDEDILVGYLQRTN